MAARLSGEKREPPAAVGRGGLSLSPETHIEVTKGPGSRAAGLAFGLIETTERRRCYVDGPALVALGPPTPTFCDSRPESSTPERVTFGRGALAIFTSR
jgi:hypothetical protein